MKGRFSRFSFLTKWRWQHGVSKWHRRHPMYYLLDEAQCSIVSERDTGKMW